MKLFKFREALAMSLRSIASNKARAFLTALGVMIRGGRRDSSGGPGKRGPGFG